MVGREEVMRLSLLLRLSHFEDLNFKPSKIGSGVVRVVVHDNPLWPPEPVCGSESEQEITLAGHEGYEVSVSPPGVFEFSMSDSHIVFRYLG